MNRLIILGNGFDLAHGLPTRYSDFISNYWSTIKETPHDDIFYEIDLSKRIENCTSLKSIFALEKMRPGRGGLGSYVNDRGHTVLKAKNLFFHSLNLNHRDRSWVDIELEYFKSLKDLLPTNRSESSHLTERAKEFHLGVQDIINAFDAYLNKNVMLKTKEVSSEKFEHFFKQIFKRNTENAIFLNFNYTDTIYNYQKPYKNSIVIPIHGSVGNLSNPINLGFGDERDRMYDELESINSNELLRFTKSSFYANRNHYEILDDLLSMDSYEVHIIGHSCGLSDRTLLSRIFEDTKCDKIFIHYYKYEKPDEFNESDNYLDTYRNISRHFKDKNIMRKKVKNRGYSFEIPQCF